MVEVTTYKILWRHNPEDEQKTKIHIFTSVKTSDLIGLEIYVNAIC